MVWSTEELNWYGFTEVVIKICFYTTLKAVTCFSLIKFKCPLIYKIQINSRPNKQIFINSYELFHINLIIIHFQQLPYKYDKK